jgi:hypothetical protein
MGFGFVTTSSLLLRSDNLGFTILTLQHGEEMRKESHEWTTSTKPPFRLFFVQILHDRTPNGIDSEDRKISA